MCCTDNKLRKLLIIFSRQDIGIDQLYDIRNLTKDLDWDQFLVLAKKHKIVNLIWWNIIQHQIASWFPIKVIDELEAGYISNTKRNTVLLDEMNRLQDMFEKKDVSCIPVKGAILLGTVYRQYGIRELSDIDFFLDSDNIEGLETVMLSAQYELGDIDLENHRVIPYSRKRKVHTRMFTNSLGSFYKFINLPDCSFVFCDFRLKIDGKFSIIKDIIHRAHGNRHISLEDHLLFLCYHLYTEAISVMSILNNKDLTLIKFCDIREFMIFHKDAINYNRLLHTASQYNLIDAVYYTFHYIGEIFGNDFGITSAIDMKCTSFLNKFGKNDYGGREYTWTKPFLHRLFSLDNKDEIVDNPGWRSIT